MEQQPLDHPRDSALLQRFCHECGLVLTEDPRVNVALMARAFARLPYENLTKILHHADQGRRAYRTPDVVIREHADFGAGGTCFSLTATFVYLLRSLGIEAEPILADRPYGGDTHAAAIVWLDGEPSLLDPGYLLTDPLPLIGREEIRRRTSFNEIVVTPQGNGKIDLATVSQGKKVHRLTWKTDPAEASAFMRAWDASFDWDMMHYPVLSRVRDGEQIYLQDQRLQRRSHEAVSKDQIPLPELERRIAEDFGIREEIVRRALAVLMERGDFRG